MGDTKELENKEEEKKTDTGGEDKELDAAIDKEIQTKEMKPLQDTKAGKEGDTAKDTTAASTGTSAAPKLTPAVPAGSGSAKDGSQTKDPGEEKTDGGKGTEEKKTGSNEGMDDSDEDLEKDNKTASNTAPAPAVIQKPAATDGDNGTGQENKAKEKTEAKGDLANNITVDVGLQTQDENAVKKGGEPKEDANRAFDTLKDLAGPPTEDWEKEDKDEKVTSNDKLKKQRDKLMKVRAGNLYKAVIFAKMLEKGERPAAEAKKVDQKKEGRFSRFMNSSDFDKVGKIGKLTGAVNGLAALDAGYAGSTIKSVVSFVTDFIVLVNSVRGIFNKIKNFKSSNTSTRKKIFAVLGIVSDFATAVAKVASLAKTIMGWTGKASKLAMAKAGNVSVFAGLAGQVASLPGVINTIIEMDHDIRDLKKDQAAEEKKVWSVLLDHLMDLPNGGEKTSLNETGNNAGENQDGEANQDKREAAGNGRENLNSDEVQDQEEVVDNSREKSHKQGNSHRGWKFRVFKIHPKHRKKKLSVKKAEPAKTKEPAKTEEPAKKAKPDKDLVLEAFNRGGLSDEDQAVLASYLGRERVIAKKKLQLANTGMGLITAALGIGTSISGGVSGVRGQKKLEKGEETDPDDPATKASTIIGGMTNSSILLSTAGMHFAKKGVNKEPGAEISGTIKEGLWASLHGLGSDDKNGLRSVAASLNPGKATEGDVKNAEAVVGKYETAEKQFSGSGVIYSKLFEANDIDIFKDALIAGL